MKAKSAPQLKKKLWTIFSLYIRTRDALKTTKTLTEAICITCNKRYPIKNLHAGHFIPGRKNSILFDERGVNAQCGVCNLWLKGNVVEYYEKMLILHGKDVIQELRRKNKETKQFKTFELKEMLETYTNKYRDLLGKANLPF